MRTVVRYLLQAQEYCEGGSLLSLISRGGSFATGKRLYSYCDALRWMTQAAKALQYLHESNPQVLPLCVSSHNSDMRSIHVLWCDMYIASSLQMNRPLNLVRRKLRLQENHQRESLLAKSFH
jgi:serine/threonine protein kinase